MTEAEVAALIAYVDARIEEEFVAMEAGEDGHHGSARAERLLREGAAAHLRAIAKKAEAIES